MKPIITILAIITLFASCNKTTQKENQEILFDENWKFALNEQPGAENPDYDDSEWRNINIPHDFSIEQPFNKNHKTDASGGYAYSGIGWYRKGFDIPKSAIGKRVSIRFNGIYRNSDVWINGHHLGHRPYGYSTFSYDLTPFLNTNAPNTIVVKSDTKDQPNSRWYTGAGIYRHVWLDISARKHLRENGVFIRTQKIENNKAILNFSAEVASLDTDTSRLTLKYILKSPDNSIVKEQEIHFELEGNTMKFLEETFRIDNPQLWSTENPNLYHFTCQLKDGDKILDSYATNYGIRTILFDPEKGVFLNGKHVWLKGTNNHHDGGPLGAACMDYTFERQLKLLKEMGSNALRMSHNPPAPELLEWADKLGFLVINELFDEWTMNKREYGYASHFDEWYKKDIADWIRRDRNHASVIAWSLGNEVPEQFAGKKGADVLRKLINESSQHDTTRIFTAGCNGVPSINKSEFRELINFVGYNYWEALYAEDHQKFSNRIIYGSETVNYPYQPGDCKQMHSYNDWVTGQTADYIAGEFLWTGFDYLGEAGIGEGGTGCEPWNEWTGWPKRGATCGFFDICGFKKPAYYFRKALWSNEPLVFAAVETHPSAKKLKECPFWGWPKVQPHWNHHTPGDSLTVHVYTNLSPVELFINGESHGKKHWDIQQRAFPVWEVPYQPGYIEAIGFTNDGEKVTHKIKTAGKAEKILLTTDRDTLKSNQQDIAYVTVQLLDENNNPVPFANDTIHFEVKGAGFLKAVGNGNQKSHTPFTGNKMESYLGKCLAIVQAGNQKGELILTANSENIESSKITMRVQ
jgi:beta-galactosidase